MSFGFRELATSLEYVDPDKVAVYGSQDGGWMAGNILVKDHLSSSPVIHCAILQSPIADWRQHGKNIILLSHTQQNHKSAFHASQ